MKKLIFTLCCCIITGYCFPQDTPAADSNTSSPKVLLEKKGLPVNVSKPDISLYPNPAKNKVTIQVKNFHPGMVAVKVMDAKGKLVREDNRLLTNGTEDIIMFLMLKAGIYFILVSEPGKIARKKLVIL
jgi:hypothetical protein